MENKKNIASILKVSAGCILSFLIIFLLVSSQQKKEIATENFKVNPPFNKQYKKEELGTVLSYIDCGKGLSAVSFHKGLLLAPMSFDFGGGLGDGAFVAYNVDDPKKPISVFDSREYPKRYHNRKSEHYLGDIAEIHGMYFHNDMVMLTERGPNRNGVMFLDLSPLYDNDAKTLPKIVSRFYFPDVQKSTVYDGFSFAPVWAGGRYVYAPTGSNGLYIIDTKDIKKPKLLAHLRKDQLYNQTLRSANAIGDLLILSPAAIASEKLDLVFIDVSNPANPSLINRHNIKVGYQGMVYGSRYYNGAFAAARGTAKKSEIIAYDFADVHNIKTIHLGTTEKLLKAEYLYIQDDNLFIGHYPGLSKWKVKNDSISFDVGIEPEYPKADDYAFVSPLGNLSVVTSDHIVKSRINIGVHQIEPDKKGPEFRYAIPKKGQTDVATSTKIGISFSDFIDNNSLENNAIYIEERGTKKRVPATFGHGMAIVHAIPKNPLQKNTTYDVFVTKKLLDLVGNSFEGDSLVTSFSTGSSFTDYNTSIITDIPKVINNTVTLKAISSSDKINLEYSWHFGDASKNTSFSSESKIEHQFLKPGNYNIILSARQKGTQKIIKSSAVQVIYQNLPTTKPISSSSMFLNDDILYVANSDNNTVTAINTKSGKKVYEEKTSKNPVAIQLVGGELWVSCLKEDVIDVLLASTGKFIKKIELGYGKSPYGLVYNKQQHTVYVALSGLGKVQEIDVKNYKLKRTIQLKKPLRNLAFLPEKNILIAPQFIASEQKGAFVQWVHTNTWQIEYQKRLAPSLNQDGIANGRGFPNYLGPIAVNPEQNNLWIPGKKDNLFRGLKRDGLPLVFDQTVRSIAASINIDNKTENQDIRIDLDNSDFASAAAYNPYGNIFYIATMGSQTIWAVDAYNSNNQSVFNTYGDGPNAIVINKDVSRLFIHNQLSRAIAVFDCRPNGKLKYLTSWKTVEKELFSDAVLKGKVLFNNTTRSSLSQEGYMSCASCHADGSHDGRIWDLSNLGEGLRNTIDLRGKEGMKHGMLHWTGNFDEVQDFNNQITALNQGTGFIFDNKTKTHPQLKEAKFGIHVDLDHLADYVSSLDEYPKSPYKPKENTYTKSAKKGKQHFIDLKCYSCHSGATFTDSKLRKLHNVGTQKTTSGNRLTKELTGFDTPSLISLWQSAPYLHDGSAKDLADVFYVGKGENAKAHNVAQSLDKKKFQELLDYLMELDSEDGITSKDIKSNNKAPKFEKTEYTFAYDYKYKKRTHSVGKVTAVDVDKKQSITYRLEPVGAAALFSIDSITGALSFKYNDIYFRHRFDLTKTYKRTYWLKVMAEDNANYRQNSSARIDLNVTYPEIGINHMELKSLISIHKKLDKHQKLTPKESKTFDQLNSKIEQPAPRIFYQKK